VSLPALAGGLSARPVLLGMGGPQYGIQAYLTPLGARALFGLPAGELVDRTLDLSDLIGPPAKELLDRLRTATTWADRFAHLDTVLEQVVADEAGLPAELDWVWRRLVRSGGAVGVGDLAEEVGWSRQHLGDRFRREFGLAPKVAARVMRFETARRLLVAPDRPGLAEVAARCGYYDQAHFNRDWREFSGVSPSDWIAEELPYVQDGEAGDERS
jgi:AraC-like DNA-binding protein